MRLTLLILAFLSTARARPSLHRRGLPGAVYTCTDTNFRGDCQWTAPTTQCRQPGPASLGFGIQSLGPDPGTTCALFLQFNCTGQIQTVQFPGLSTGLPQFQAFQCLPIGASGNQNPPASTPPTTPTKASGVQADPRLAGGVGSLEREEHLHEINAMKKNGFKDGLLGLKKGVCY